MIAMGFHQMSLRNNIENVSVIQFNKALSVSKCAHLTAEPASQPGERMRLSGR